MSEKLASLSSRGIGEPMAQREVIRRLAAAGAKVRVPSVHIGDARSTDFADKRFDLLLDAGSACWICGHASFGGSTLPPAKANKNLGKLVREYARISRKAVFFIAANTSGEVDPGYLAKLLKKHGAKVEKHSLDPVYVFQTDEVPVLRFFYERSGSKNQVVAPHFYSYNLALVAEFPEKKK